MLNSKPTTESVRVGSLRHGDTIFSPWLDMTAQVDWTELGHRETAEIVVVTDGGRRRIRVHQNEMIERVATPS